MATIEAGTQPKTSQDYINDLYEYVGISGFPVSLQCSTDGKLLNISVETEWKIGGTIPVEATAIINENGEKIYTEYAEEYEDKLLTSGQTAKINQWISENVEA